MGHRPPLFWGTSWALTLLSPSQLRVLAAICSHIPRGKSHAWPSAPTIAAELSGYGDEPDGAGISEVLTTAGPHRVSAGQVRRVIRELVELRVLIPNGYHRGTRTPEYIVPRSSPAARIATARANLAVGFREMWKLTYAGGAAHREGGVALTAMTQMGGGAHRTGGVRSPHGGGALTARGGCADGHAQSTRTEPQVQSPQGVDAIGHEEEQRRNREGTERENRRAAEQVDLFAAAAPAAAPLSLSAEEILRGEADALPPNRAVNSLEVRRGLIEVWAKAFKVSPELLAGPHDQQLLSALRQALVREGRTPSQLAKAVLGAGRDPTYRVEAGGWGHIARNMQRYLTIYDRAQRARARLRQEREAADAALEQEAAEGGEAEGAAELRDLFKAARHVAREERQRRRGDA